MSSTDDSGGKQVNVDVAVEPAVEPRPQLEDVPTSVDSPEILTTWSAGHDDHLTCQGSGEANSFKKSISISIPKESPPTPSQARLQRSSSPRAEHGATSASQSPGHSRPTTSSGPRGEVQDVNKQSGCMSPSQISEGSVRFARYRAGDASMSEPPSRVSTPGSAIPRSTTPGSHHKHISDMLHDGFHGAYISGATAVNQTPIFESPSPSQHQYFLGELEAASRPSSRMKHGQGSNASSGVEGTGFCTDHKRSPSQMSASSDEPPFRNMVPNRQYTDTFVMSVELPEEDAAILKSQRSVSLGAGSGGYRNSITKSSISTKDVERSYSEYVAERSLREEAATRIQAMTRAKFARERTQRLRVENRSALRIQCISRGFLARKQVNRMYDAIVQIQRFMREQWERRYREYLEEMKRIKHEMWENSPYKLKKLWGPKTLPTILRPEKFKGDMKHSPVKGAFKTKRKGSPSKQRRSASVASDVKDIKVKQSLESREAALTAMLNLSSPTKGKVAGSPPVRSMAWSELKNPNRAKDAPLEPVGSLDTESVGLWDHLKSPSKKVKSNKKSKPQKVKFQKVEIWDGKKALSPSPKKSTSMGTRKNPPQNTATSTTTMGANDGGYNSKYENLSVRVPAAIPPRTSSKGSNVTDTVPKQNDEPGEPRVAPVTPLFSGLVTPNPASENLPQEAASSEFLDMPSPSPATNLPTFSRNESSLSYKQSFRGGSRTVSQGMPQTRDISEISGIYGDTDEEDVGVGNSVSWVEKLDYIENTEPARFVDIGRSPPRTVSPKRGVNIGDTDMDKDFVATVISSAPNFKAMNKRTLTDLKSRKRALFPIVSKPLEESSSYERINIRITVYTDSKTPFRTIVLKPVEHPPPEQESNDWEDHLPNGLKLDLDFAGTTSANLRRGLTYALLVEYHHMETFVADYNVSIALTPLLRSFDLNLEYFCVERDGLRNSFAEIELCPVEGQLHLPSEVYKRTEKLWLEENDESICNFRFEDVIHGKYMIKLKMPPAISVEDGKTTPNEWLLNPMSQTVQVDAALTTVGFVFDEIYVLCSAEFNAKCILNENLPSIPDGMGGLIDPPKRSEFVLSGMQILLKQAERSFTWEGVTDGNGSLSIKNIPIGTYEYEMRDTYDFLPKKTGFFELNPESLGKRRHDLDRTFHLSLVSTQPPPRRLVRLEVLMRSLKPDVAVSSGKYQDSDYLTGVPNFMLRISIDSTGMDPIHPCFLDNFKIDTQATNGIVPIPLLEGEYTIRGRVVEDDNEESVMSIEHTWQRLEEEADFILQSGCSDVETISLHFTRNVYLVKFHVHGEKGEPVYRAKCSVWCVGSYGAPVSDTYCKPAVICTGQDGHASFQLVPGEYRYQVASESVNHITQTGIFEISDHTSLDEGLAVSIVLKDARQVRIMCSLRTETARAALRTGSVPERVTPHHDSDGFIAVMPHQVETPQDQPRPPGYMVDALEMACVNMLEEGNNIGEPFNVRSAEFVEMSPEPAAMLILVDNSLSMGEMDPARLRYEAVKRTIVEAFDSFGSGVSAIRVEQLNAPFLVKNSTICMSKHDAQVEGLLGATELPMNVESHHACGWSQTSEGVDERFGELVHGPLLDDHVIGADHGMPCGTSPVFRRAYECMKNLESRPEKRKVLFIASDGNCDFSDFMWFDRCHDFAITNKIEIHCLTLGASVKEDFQELAELSGGIHFFVDEPQLFADQMIRATELIFKSHYRVHFRLPDKHLELAANLGHIKPSQGEPSGERKLSYTERRMSATQRKNSKTPNARRGTYIGMVGQRNSSVVKTMWNFGETEGGTNQVVLVPINLAYEQHSTP